MRRPGRRLMPRPRGESLPAVRRARDRCRRGDLDGVRMSGGVTGMDAVVRALGATRFRRLATGSAIADDVKVGGETFIGNNVTLYPRIDIGTGCIVLDGAVIGRIPI